MPVFLPVCSRHTFRSLLSAANVPLPAGLQGEFLTDGVSGRASVPFGGPNPLGGLAPGEETKLRILEQSSRKSARVQQFRRLANALEDGIPGMELVRGSGTFVYVCVQHGVVNPWQRL